MTRKTFFKIILALIFVFSLKIFTQTYLPHPYNLDFEIGEVGKLPAGWTVPSYADKLGYKAYLADYEPLKNKYCLELTRDGEFIEDIYGSVMQSIDAKPYRGKRIRFRAAVKAEIWSPKGSAHLWIRERFKDDDQIGLFDFMADKPIVIRQWNYYQIEGYISKDALFINFGLMLFGNGKAWIDDASFEIIDDASSVTSETYKLETNKINELVDFAKLYGLCRYFYPSDESKKIDWDKFALLCVDKILRNDTIDPDTLLVNLFTPLCPLLKILPNPQDFVHPKFNNALKDVALYYAHYGFPTSTSSHPIIKSQIHNLFVPIVPVPGSVSQIVHIRDFTNAKAEISLSAKGYPKHFSTKFYLILSFENQSGLIKSPNNRKIYELDIYSSNWKNLKFEFNFPNEAEFLKIEFLLAGLGTFYIDKVLMKIDGSETELIKNPSFEQGKDSILAFGWKLSEKSKNEGYFAIISSENPVDGNKVLKIIYEPENKFVFPNLDSTFSVKLNNGKFAVVPSTIHIDSFRTLPHSSINNLLAELESIDYNLINPSSRLATTIILWNLIYHFNIYKNPAFDDTVLATLLEKAASATSTKEFLQNLQEMLHFVEDNLARIWHPETETEFTFPFQWKFDNGKIIITEIKGNYPNELVNSEVIKINNIDSKQYLDSISTFISFSNTNWKYLKALAYTRYYSDSTISLTLKTKAGKIYDFQFSKNTSVNEFFEPRPQRIEFLDKDILYIDLTRMKDEQLKKFLDSLPRANYFIFDLRGFVMPSEHFLSYFTDYQITSPDWFLPIFTLPFSGEISWKRIASQIPARAKISFKEIYFLIDERTVGVGEVIAMIVRKYKIGKLVGTKTGGSPSETIQFALPGNFFVSWSFTKVRDYEGKFVYRKGIQPHIPTRDRENPLDRVVKNIKINY